MRLKGVFTRISTFLGTDRGKSVIKWTQRVINIAVVGWLVYELTTIGWLKVWYSLPTTPLFYLLFLFVFFQLPLFEVFVYRFTWHFDAIKSIPVFLLKRVYNKDVVGYSGELYFFMWAKKTLHKSGKEVLKIIKDNNIISSVASTLISIGLIAAFLFAGQIKIIELIANKNQIYFYGGLATLIVIIILFVKFRRYVISMPLNTAYKIFGLQMVRMLLGQLMNLLMYYVVLPEVPLYIWFTFIAVDIVLSRIPFIPNRDLIFAGLGIALAGTMAVPKDAVAGIVLAKGVLNKVGGLLCFGLSNLFTQSSLVKSPEQGMEEYSEIRRQAG